MRRFPVTFATFWKLSRNSEQRVALYVAMPFEPSVNSARKDLRELGVTVLVPVVSGHDLFWAADGDERCWERNHLAPSNRTSMTRFLVLKPCPCVRRSLFPHTQLIRLDSDSARAKVSTIGRWPNLPVSSVHRFSLASPLNPNFFLTCPPKHMTSPLMRVSPNYPCVGLIPRTSCIG